MTKSDTELGDKFADSKLKFKPASWPKINFQNEVKEDLIRSFNIFDKDGQGVISLDAVEVALRALGHDLDAKESEVLKVKFPDRTVVFNDYMKILSDWILNIDEDLDVSKAFSLFDVDGKGYINLDDLRRVRDQLGFLHEIQDDELIEMLIGAQVEDSAQELKEIYASRQNKTRLRKALDNGIPVVMNGGNETATWSSAPSLGAINHRRMSSDDNFKPSELSVDLEKFRRVLQLEAPPPEPI
ncbi:unnamed protein product [Rodentolepis nana]|uniref:EF-hand domain-containing protein n=1 Tax=Rodentolepis nana TaxID=102285 RepID=A0A0R3T6D0_RODNA|nr:unnamed protein product [Rodentolepis nana]